MKTKEEKKAYAKEYREDGLGKLADRRYYAKNAERLRAESAKRYLRRKLRALLSREHAEGLQGEEKSATFAEQ